LVLDVLEERALIGLVDVPEAEIVLVDAHFERPATQPQKGWETVGATAE
jgi:hypothetical protein